MSRSATSTGTVHAVRSETLFGWAKKAWCGYRFPKRTKVRDGTANVNCRRCHKRMP